MSFWSQQSLKSEDPCFCLETVDLVKDVIVRMGCGHVCHYTCFVDLCSRDRKCPYCREKITLPASSFQRPEVRVGVRHSFSRNRAQSPVDLLTHRVDNSPPVTRNIPAARAIRRSRQRRRHRQRQLEWDVRNMLGDFPLFMSSSSLNPDLFSDSSDEDTMMAFIEREILSGNTGEEKEEVKQAPEVTVRQVTQATGATFFRGDLPPIVEGNVSVLPPCPFIRRISNDDFYISSADRDFNRSIRWEWNHENFPQGIAVVEGFVYPPPPTPYIIRSNSVDRIVEGLPSFLGNTDVFVPSRWHHSPSSPFTVLSNERLFEVVREQMVPQWTQPLSDSFRRALIEEIPPDILRRNDHVIVTMPENSTVTSVPVSAGFPSSVLRGLRALQDSIDNVLTGLSTPDENTPTNSEE